MPLSDECLPHATPLDPTEEPPGSIDPLGTLSAAERLADVFLPGFTARMWRARLLTLATVSAAMADRVAASLEDREDSQLEARLAFERLYVGAIVRAHQKDPVGYAMAKRGLPGTDLARRALYAGEPLTRGNFLKGQAVNGPFGVIVRLARNLELVDEDGSLGRNGLRLLLTWSEEQNLAGVLDDDGLVHCPGAVWAADVTRHVVAYMKKNQWPGAGQKIWEQLVTPLRLDQVGPMERQCLSELLETDAVRRRMLEILRNAVQVYRDVSQGNGRGWVERTVFRNAVDPALEEGPVDCVIRVANLAVEAYEATTAALQQAFDGLLWGLKYRGGRAAPELLLADPRLSAHLESSRAELSHAIVILDRAIEQMQGVSSLASALLIDPLLRVCEEAQAAAPSSSALVETVLSRHERVQREKRKSAWIDRGIQWTLMPGFGVDGELPAVYSEIYLHPFRIRNAYSLFADLGHVSLEVADGEE